LDGRLVGTRVRLANGKLRWALLGNVRLHSRYWTGHLVTLSVRRGRRWFTLARYHDSDHKRRGPRALAAFLGYTVGEVFPIEYQIEPSIASLSEGSSGVIEAKPPAEPLSRAYIVRMAARGV
jgi:hypothetical protein